MKSPPFFSALLSICAKTHSAQKPPDFDMERCGLTSYASWVPESATATFKDVCGYVRGTLQRVGCQRVDAMFPCKFLCVVCAGERDREHV